MSEEMRKSGIDVILDVPWGTHFCQLYQTKEELSDILVPYFKAGLENNEFCIWITSNLLDIEEAKEAFRKVIHDFDAYLEKGQIEIVPYAYWYIKDGIFDPETKLNGLIKKYNQGMEKGYEGLRLAENVSWQEKKDWDNLVNYEIELNAITCMYKMIALCSYLLNVSNVTEVIDVVSNHQFTLVKKEGKWERIENSGRKSIVESKRTEEALHQSEQRFDMKLKSIPPPVRDITNLELAKIVDVQAIQPLLNDFYKLTHIPIGLNDLKGNVLAGAGWQDICTRFHRAHPETCKHCIESDTGLSAGIISGEFKLYKCKNNMWDIATPIMVGDRQVGLLLLGQFFFEDEPLDYGLFRSQARKYGFTEKEYLEVLEKVPRLNRRAVETGTTFLMKLANMISQLSYSNIKLAHSLAERDSLVDALRESEKRERARSDELKVVLDAVPVAVYIAHDPEALQISGNRLSYEWLRIPVGTNFSKSAPEGEKPEMFKLCKNGVEIPPAKMPSQMSAAGIEINDCELDIVSADGEVRHVLGNARPLRDAQGNPHGSISAFIDITERKKAEEALRFSNLYNRSLIEASLDPLVTIGREGKITDVNNATEQVTGYSRNHLIGTDFSDYFTEPEKARKGYQEVFIEGEVRDYPLEIQHKDGHIIPVLYNASVYKDENGKVVGVFAAARDITELKKAEEALKKEHGNLEKLVEERTTQLEKAYDLLKESESGLAEAQKMAHIGNWEWDIAAERANWSAEMYRIFRRDPQELPLSYDEYLSYIHPDDRDCFYNAAKKAMDGIPCSIDHRTVLPNGEIRTVHVQSEVICNDRSIPVRIKGIIQDITERKKTEKALIDLEITRKKEIHHRIKNNLQVISSLLDLQAENLSNRKYIKESDLLNAFKESQNRIMSIALIHEELHEGGGDNTLNFSLYLERLVRNLFQTYRLGNTSICLNIDLEENIFFDMDTAVPLGIIVNELVSNSLEHAFPDKSKGEIRIKLFKEKSGKDLSVEEEEPSGKDTRYILIVSDDGVGIPREIYLEKSNTLGLQLVNTLVDQLDCELELKTDAGTKFIIRINV